MILGKMPSHQYHSFGMVPSRSVCKTPLVVKVSPGWNVVESKCFMPIRLGVLMPGHGGPLNLIADTDVHVRRLLTKLFYFQFFSSQDCDYHSIRHCNTRKYTSPGVRRRANSGNGECRQIGCCTAGNDFWDGVPKTESSQPTNVSDEGIEQLVRRAPLNRRIYSSGKKN